MELCQEMPTEDGVIGAIVLDIGDDGFVEASALGALRALARAGLVSPTTIVSPRSVQVMCCLATRDSDDCAGFDCSAFDRRLRCTLPRETLKATEAKWAEATAPFALRTWTAASAIASCEAPQGRQLKVGVAKTAVCTQR